jgi:hypothetical protein
VARHEGLSGGIFRILNGRNVSRAGHYEGHLSDVEFDTMKFRIVSGAVLGQVLLSGSEKSPFLCHIKNPIASEHKMGFYFLPTQIPTL